MVTTRSARAGDAPSVAALVTQLGYESTSEEVAQRLARVLARSDGWVHVELAEYVESGPFAAIGGLVVDRVHRRQGIGAALMAGAEAWARQQGCGVMRLWSSTTRTPAHRFYEGLGYAQVKTQYSFVKPLDASGADLATRLVPRVESETR